MENQISAFNFIESLVPISKERIERRYQRYVESKKNIRLDKTSLYIQDVPSDMKYRLKKLAAGKGISLETYIIRALGAIAIDHYYCE